MSPDLVARRRLLGAPLLLVLGSATAAQDDGTGGTTTGADTCRGRSGPAVPTIVELYTSEGCNSCPPADRWLSSLQRRADLIALAFHVDYWDRLGWKDRFADPAFTLRQQRLQASSGARFVYTPQVLVNGRDWRGWPRAGLPAAAPSTVAIELHERGGRLEAELTPLAGAPAQLGGYWAVLEHGHSSRVSAGENAGRTLHHDHVVRRYSELSPWTARGPHRIEIARPERDGTPAARDLAIVVTDGPTGRPVSALRLAC